MLKKVIAIIMAIYQFTIGLAVTYIKTDKGADFTVVKWSESSWDGESLLMNGKTRSISSDSSNLSSTVPAFNINKKCEIIFQDTDNDWFNFFGIAYKSGCYLKGEINYWYNFKSYTETFFLEPSESVTQFYQLIDGYVSNMVGYKIQKLTFTCLDKDSTTFELLGINTWHRAYVKDYIYTSNEKLKIGVSLKWGGALTYLEDIDSNVEAVRMNNGKLVVDRDASSKVDGKVVNENVNLINRNDTGRLVQQSYYGTTGENDDYEPGSYTYGAVWAYNPVQGGNQYNDQSKIVDFRVSDGVIHIKCRPLDWAKKKDCITPSYMEADYRLEDGTVKVSCRFVDFSGYAPSVRSQELPAFYTISAFSDFYYYSGSNPWIDEDVFTCEDSLIFWPDAGYPHFNSKENWCAFLSKNSDYGIGLYVPGIESFLVGIADRDGKLKDDPSASGPTSYIAATDTFTFSSYSPYAYDFYISTGTLQEMRSDFYSIHNSH